MYAIENEVFLGEVLLIVHWIVGRMLQLREVDGSTNRVTNTASAWKADRRIG